MNLGCLFLRKDIEKLITCKGLAMTMKASESIHETVRERDTDSLENTDKIKSSIVSSRMENNHASAQNIISVY